jgi:hypothetical protein
MIVVVITYKDRPYQLNRTLLSFNNSKSDFRVVVVDDNSLNEIELPRIKYPIDVIKLTDKNWVNCEPVLNYGIIKAIEYKPDILLMQNAECQHIGDVIEHASHVTDDNYYSFACFSLSRESTYQNKMPINHIGASKDGQDAWYNHSIYRPVAYDFCAAITVSNMIRLNGYDERLSAGWGYGDNYFLERIKMMGLRIEIIDSPFVCHQWHYNMTPPENRAELIERNRILYHELLQQHEIKAKHLITPDLCASCL